MIKAIERQIVLPIKIGGPIISPKPIDKLIKIADIRNLSEDQRNSINTDIVLCKNTTNGHYSFLIKSENERFHFDKELYSNDENSPKKKISSNEEIFFNQEKVLKNMTSI